MKLRNLVVFIVLSIAICVAAVAAKPKYPLTVHVASSDFSATCTANYMCYGLQKLTVTIDGSKYMLASEDTAVVTGIGPNLANVLKNGDYPGRIIHDDQIDAAEYHRVIELQVADGVAKRYTVVGELGD